MRHSVFDFTLIPPLKQWAFPFRRSVKDNDGVVEVTTDYAGPVRIIIAGNLDSVGEDEAYATDKDGDMLYARTEYEKQPEQKLINYFQGIDKRCEFCGRIDSDEKLKKVGGYQILDGCSDCEEDIQK